MNIHAVKAEYRRTWNPGMLVAVAGVIFCICFDSWNSLITAIGSGNGNVHYFFWNSAFGGVCRSYFLPIFSAIPFAASFCKEYEENSLPYIVAREGKKGYCITKFIVNAVSGGLTVALGTAILFSLLACIFPVADTAYQAVSPGEDLHFWIAQYRPWVYGIIETANGFLTGILWSCVALCVSAYLPNPFVAVTSPYLVSFALAHAFRLLKVDNLYRLDKWLTGYSIIGSSAKTLCISFATVLLIVFFLGILFTKKVRRRVENELHR